MTIKTGTWKYFDSLIKNLNLKVFFTWMLSSLKHSTAAWRSETSWKTLQVAENFQMLLLHCRKCYKYFYFDSLLFLLSCCLFYSIPSLDLISFPSKRHLKDLLDFAISTISRLLPNLLLLMWDMKVNRFWIFQGIESKRWVLRFNV